MGTTSKTVYQTSGFVLQDELRDHRYYLPSFAQRGTISREDERQALILGIAHRPDKRKRQ